MKQYKDQFGYLSVASNINPYIIGDYSNFKNQILKDKKFFTSCISNISIQIENREVTPPTPYELKNLSSSYIQNTVFPLDFLPIKEDIINEYTCKNFNFYNKNLFLYEIIIGDDNILAIDNKNKLNIFVCKYSNDKKCFNPCSLFSFQEEIGIKEMIECACNRKGISNYYKMKNINEDGEIEQDISDEKGTLIGSYVSFKEKFKSDEGKTILFGKGGNGKVQFKGSINNVENINEENTLSINQISTNKSNNESINKESNGNTLIVTIEDINKREIKFKKSINDLSFVNEENKDNSKPIKIKDNLSLDTIKEENDISQSINPKVSFTKKSKRISVKSNDDQKKFIYNIMGEIYYYGFFSRNNTYYQSNSKNDVIFSDIEIIDEKQSNNINNVVSINKNEGGENIVNPMSCLNQLNKENPNNINYYPINNNNINQNPDCNNNNILFKFVNTNNQNMNCFNNKNKNNPNNPNKNKNDSISQNISFFNKQNINGFNNQNMNVPNNPNMNGVQNQNMNNYNNQNMNVGNNQNMNNYNDQNINNNNEQNINNCNVQNINNYYTNQDMKDNNIGNFTNRQNMNDCNYNQNINNFNCQNMINYNQNQNFNNNNGNQNPNMAINDFNQNQNMNYFNSSSFNNNNGNIQFFGSNTNYLDQNNTIKNFAFNLMESNNPDNKIKIILSSPELNLFYDIEASSDENLSEIIKSQKWLREKNIESIKLDNRNLDLDKPLGQQGLISNSRIDIYFKDKSLQ